MNATAQSARATSDRFFLYVTLCLLVGVIVGFSPTLYLRRVFDGPEMPWWLVVHGITQTAWFVLLAIQASLNASHRRAWHKRIGWLSVAVGVVAMSITPLVMARAVPRGLAAGLQEFEVDFVFLVNLLRIPFFAVMLVLAMRAHRHRDVHARALLLASFSNFTPAGSRISHLVDVNPLAGALFFIAAFGIPLALHDRRTLGHVHPLTRLGNLVLVLIIVIPIVLLVAGWGQPLVRALV